MNIVKLEHINKKFDEHIVLDDYSMEVKENSFTVIFGPSGCGKSTLLNLIGLLDSPDSGKIELFGRSDMKPYTAKAEKLLREKIGYLFQNFALEDDETVETNLAVALEYDKAKKSAKKERVAKALERVGLKGYEKKKIHECSGGEQQRIAMARILLKPCELILADEPTGNLDEENKHMVFEMLKTFVHDGKTLIVVTHDEELREMADNCITLA